MLNYNIVDISSGLSHNAVIGIERKKNKNSPIHLNYSIFTWGNGYSGALGHGTTDDERFPKLINFFYDKLIKEVYCGYSHTTVLTSIQKIFTNDKYYLNIYHSYLNKI